MLPALLLGLMLSGCQSMPEGVEPVGNFELDRYLAEWAVRTRDWLARGDRVFMMIHCPNNLHCPELARAFHEALRSMTDVPALPALPPWPVPEQGRLI